MIAFRVEIASGAHSRAKAFASATSCLAVIVVGFLGRPPGLPETPGLKLVDRGPPRGIVSARLIVCLFQLISRLLRRLAARDNPTFRGMAGRLVVDIRRPTTIPVGALSFMNAVEIEEAVSALADRPFDREEFPFAFLEAFGNKETTLNRLRKGERTSRTSEEFSKPTTSISLLPLPVRSLNAGCPNASPRAGQGEVHSGDRWAVA